MRELITFGATHPQIPLVLGVLLYLWISVASYMIGKPALAGMWFCYAIANAFMVWNYNGG